MNPETAENLFRCYRADRKELEDARIQKAVRYAEENEELKKKLLEQVEFDDRIANLIKAIAPSEILEEKLSALSGNIYGRNALKQPAILAVAIGVLVVIGVLVYSGFNRLHSFGGKESVTKMIARTVDMSGLDLEPVATEAGNLGDWFFLKFGLEHYHVPPAFSDLKTVGCGVFKQDGHSVAQIAIDKNAMFLYIFRAKDFNVKLNSPDRWQFFEEDEWAIAIREYNENCFMIAFRGTESEMKNFLAEQEK